MYTQLHLKWITNKDLLYSTCIFDQSYERQSGWEWGLGRIDADTHVWLSPFAVKLPQHG